MTDESNDIQVEVSEQAQADGAAEQEQQPTGGETPEKEAPRGEEGHGEETGDDETDEQQSDADGEHEDVPYGVRKKLGKLTARVKSRDETIAKLTQDLEQERQQREILQKSQVHAPQKIEEKPRPTLEDCNYDVSEYDKQLQSWTEDQVKLGVQRVETEREKQKRQIGYNEKVVAFAKTAPDFPLVVQSLQAIPVNEAMIDVIQDMDGGPAVTYYLGKHLSEALDIAQMSPHKAGLALARIEAKLAKESTPQRNTITSAPPPVKTLNPSAPIKKDLAELPMSEYVKERQKARRKSSGFL